MFDPADPLRDTDSKRIIRPGHEKTDKKTIDAAGGFPPKAYRFFATSVDGV
jgi:hypothetical protein